MDSSVREALELILRPTTSTAEKIVRCSELQEGLQKNIISLTESLHKVSTQCAERSGRVPQALDAHVSWVKHARQRASNVRKSLDSTKERLQLVLKHLQRQANAEDDRSQRTEAQMKGLTKALEERAKSGSFPNPSSSTAATTSAAAEAVSAADSASVAAAASTTTTTETKVEEKEKETVVVEEEEEKKEEKVVETVEEEKKEVEKEEEKEQEPVATTEEKEEVVEEEKEDDDGEEEETEEVEEKEE